MGLKNLDNVRAKSGIGERQLTEAASDVKSIDDAAASVNAADASPLLRINDVNLKKLAADSEADGSSLMKRLDEIVKQKKQKRQHQALWKLFLKLIFQANVQHLENF